MTFTQTVRQFLIENPVFNDFAFRCQTFEEAEILVKALYNLGYYFEKGKPYDKNLLLKRWNVKKENTCLAIGSLNTTDPKIMFTGRMGMYVNQGRVIVNVSTLIEMSETGNVSNISAIEEPDDTKVCPNCGNLVSIKAKFCTNCGEKFEVIAESQPETPITENVVAETELVAESASVKENTPTVVDSVPIVENSPVITNETIVENDNAAKNEPAVEKEIITEEPAEDIDIKEPSKETETEKLSEASETKEQLKETETEDATTNNISEETKTSEIEQPVENQDIIEAVQVIDNVLSETEETKENTQIHIPVLCEILGLFPFQPFRIKNDYYFAENYIYRINDKGIREVKVGEDLWFVANNEQELEYIIEHKNQILVVRE